MKTVSLIQIAAQDEDEAIRFMPVPPRPAGATWQGNGTSAPNDGRRRKRLDGQIFRRERRRPTCFPGVITIAPNDQYKSGHASIEGYLNSAYISLRLWMWTCGLCATGVSSVGATPHRHRPNITIARQTRGRIGTLCLGCNWAGGNFKIGFLGWTHTHSSLSWIWMIDKVVLEFIG